MSAVTLEPTLTSMNGLELNKSIKTQLGKRVDLMYLLKQGNTFHRAHIFGTIKVECYSKDVPVPEIDFDFNIDAPSAQQFVEGFIKIDELKAKRDKLQEALDKINATLNTVAPTDDLSFDQSTVDASGNDTPDKMRIENNLPIPMLKRSGGTVTEVMVPAKDLNIAP